MKMSFTHKFIQMQIKLIFILNVSHLDSFWNRGKRQLGNYNLLELAISAIYGVRHHGVEWCNYAVIILCMYACMPMYFTPIRLGLPSINNLSTTNEIADSNIRVNPSRYRFLRAIWWRPSTMLCKMVETPLVKNDLFSLVVLSYLFWPPPPITML